MTTWIQLYNVSSLFVQYLGVLLCSKQLDLLVSFVYDRSVASIGYATGVFGNYYGLCMRSQLPEMNWHRRVALTEMADRSVLRACTQNGNKMLALRSV